MSAYLIDDGVVVGVTKFRCSNCGDNIRVDHSADKLKHCWNCGVKFEPKPATPTEGEWRYESSTCRLFSTQIDRDVLIGYVRGYNGKEELHANGYLMASSKKLLAAIKPLVALRPIHGSNDYIKAAEQAIAAAEGKQSPEQK